MANSAKGLTRLDYEGAIKASYNDEDATLSVNGFLTGLVGRKVTVTSGATTDTYTFSENAVTLYVILVTYVDASKTVLLSAERTA